MEIQRQDLISNLEMSIKKSKLNLNGSHLNLSSSLISEPASGGAGSGNMNNLSNSSNSSSTNGLSHSLIQNQATLNALSSFQQQQQQYQQQQQQVDSIEANKGYTFEEQFKQLYELSNDPKRKEFLDDLFQFMADRNQPVNRIPIMAKQVLDLYELYNLVVARGGLVEVINKKIWREITKGLNLPSSITSAAFTLRTQYMKYLYPYECAKNNFSHQDELQQAIDGNRREGRRAGAVNGHGAPMTNPAGLQMNLANYAGYLNGAATGDNQHHLGHYSASPSPNHLFAAAASAAGTNILNQSANHQHHHHHQQQQQLHHELGLRDQQQSGSSNASPSESFNQQRLYQDSIESDHDDDDQSIDLSHSPKRNSPIDEDHLNHHNQNLNQQQQQQQQPQHQAADQQQQQFAAAAAAAIRQQLGAALNFAGAQNIFCQLANQVPQTGNANLTAIQQAAAQQTIATNNAANINGNPPNQADILKQQQEQFLAALMAAAGQQQQQQPPQPHPQQQQQQQQPGATHTDQQAAARAALSNVATNAMLISAPNAPEAMAVATAAQAIGVKGAFIILLL